MKVINSSIIYENPLPQLRSRHSFFPNIAELSDGTLAAAYVIGEAFESVDSKSYLSISRDGGISWSKPERIFDHGENETRYTEYAKITALPDGRLAAMGYAFLRDDPELPIGNPETGGLLPDFPFFAVSDSDVRKFGKMTPISCRFGSGVEASAPITVLENGDWITPITGFPDWSGKMSERVCGRALRSSDEGETWNDESVCMDFDGDVTCYELRMCKLDSGALVCIGWNERISTGERLDNHFTISYDGGKTWSTPKSTCVRGQASSVCAIGGERLLALHAVRRDTDRPGIYAYVIDLSYGEWKIIDKSVVWEPETPILKDNKMAEVFSFLKFGQPGAIMLSDGDVMMSHWYCKEGQYKTLATRIRLN